MKKFLIALVITVSLAGLLFPAQSQAVNSAFPDRPINSADATAADVATWQQTKQTIANFNAADKALIDAVAANPKDLGIPALTQTRNETAALKNAAVSSYTNSNYDALKEQNLNTAAANAQNDYNNCKGTQDCLDKQGALDNAKYDVSAATMALTNYNATLNRAQAAFNESCLGANSGSLDCQSKLTALLNAKEGVTTPNLPPGTPTPLTTAEKIIYAAGTPARVTNTGPLGSVVLPPAAGAPGSVEGPGSITQQGNQIVAAKMNGTPPADSLSGCQKDLFTSECLYEIIDTIGNAILSMAAWILGVCGVLFNYVILAFVVQMKDRIVEISAIYSTWQIVRDLANMFFIFILLIIAIQTILDIGYNYKTVLRNVILVALFINFSFFFTGLMIDASNIIALQFYNGFVGKNSDQISGGVSAEIRDGLGLGTIYQVNATTGTTSSATLAGPTGSKFGVGRFLITVVMGSILMIVTGGILLASAVLIFYRFVELIILLMFSPLAFATLTLPSLRSQGWNEWWTRLTKQLIFAPVYFMFLWVTIRVITSDIFKVHATTSTFVGSFGGSIGAITSLFSNYLLVIIMLTYSLTLASKLGANASGIKLATSVSKGFQGFIGRNTVGKAAYGITNSRAMKGLTAISPILGRIASKPFDSLSKQGFGSQVGYDKAMEKRKKDLIAGGKYVSDTGPLVKGILESKDHFKDRKQEAEDAGKARLKKYAGAISGNDKTSPVAWIEKVTGITAALRSNKEAGAVLSKQVAEGEDKVGREKARKDEVAKINSELPALEQRVERNMFVDEHRRTIEKQSGLEAAVILASKGDNKDVLAKAIFEQNKFQIQKEKRANLRNEVNAKRTRRDNLERDRVQEKEWGGIATKLGKIEDGQSNSGGGGRGPKPPQPSEGETKK